MLYRAGFTDRLLAPAEERYLLQHGLGVTNLVARTTAAANELTRVELAKGRVKLEAKIERYEPQIIAVLGIGVYRTAFDKPKTAIGLQPEPLGRTAVWVLPNPSGLNAHYQMPALVRMFRALRKAAGL